MSASRQESANKKNSETSDLESKLESQTKALWVLKDNLKKHVTTAELRAMLDANDQVSTGSELDLRDRWYLFSSCYTLLVSNNFSFFLIFLLLLFFLKNVSLAVHFMLFGVFLLQL